MARLIPWASGIRYASLAPLSGPRSIGSGGSQTIGGYTQTVASPFGLWRWQFGFAPLRGAGLRRYRGMIAALHGGANAVRVPIYDPDIMPYTRAQMLGAEGLPVVRGIEFASTFEDRIALAIGDDTDDELALGDGTDDVLMSEPNVTATTTRFRVGGTSTTWSYSFPHVYVAAGAAKDATTIYLNNAAWGHRLIVGDYIGFGPLYFGLHVVTEVYSEGVYRVWPPLRRAITTADWATLNPTIAMRMEGEEAGAVVRGQYYADGLTLTLVEVEDADVRAYFNE